MTDASDAAITPPATTTQLRGRVLLVVRLVWLVVSVMVLWYGVVLFPIFMTNLSAAVISSVEEEIVRPMHIAMAMIASIVMYFVVAGVIAWRRSNDWMALFVSLTLMLFGTVLFSYLTYIPTDSLVGRAVDALLRGIGWGCLVFFFLLFPNGRFVPGRVRWPAIMWAIYALLWPIFPAIDPHNSHEGNFFFLLLIVGLGFGALVQVIRYNEVANLIEQQQTKLCLLGFITTFLVILIAMMIAPVVWGAALFLLMLSFIFIPLSIGVAILRYRLFDTDVVIRNTLIYSILSLTLALVYIICIVVSRALVAPLTGGSELAIVASTLTMAALFVPLRQRIQTVIDRRFYRRKYDAAKVLAAFAARMRDDTDLDTLTNDLLWVVDETMKPAHISLWLRDTSNRGTPDSARSDTRG